VQQTKGTQLSDVTPSSAGTEALLKQLLEMARSAALAEMAGGIAHELNQPLGAIATFAQAGDRLLNRPEPLVERALDVFRQITAEALAAGEEIRRIRGRFNHASTERTCTQMPAIIEELRPVLEVMAHCARVTLTLAVAVPVPDVVIEKLPIQHVVFTMVQNALHACADSDRPRRTRLAVRADRYAVEVSVTDSGPGIAIDSSERVFRPFFTTKPCGAGLGLASCRAIVGIHGGTIGFEPVTDGGARFWFRLPVEGP
jgi:C4-dicarboxylate-specific signal transduction histidine kinase